MIVRKLHCAVKQREIISMNNCVTLHLLNDTALEQAKALQEANRIEFYGNGGSGIIATDA